MFKKATAENLKLRLALNGVSGSGKTYSALAIAQFLAPNSKIALIDSEHGSASRYAKYFDFDVCNLETFSLQTYIKTIEEANKLGYEVIIVDSLSHAWFDELDKTSNAKNSYTAWGPLRILERKLIDLIFRLDCHFIGTMRTKTEYVLEMNNRGKMEPKKIGTQAVQKQGIEYEFDVVGELDIEHSMRITKTRFTELDSKIYIMPGGNFAEDVLLALQSNPESSEKSKSKSQDFNHAKDPYADWKEAGMNYFIEQGLDKTEIQAMIDLSKDRKTLHQRGLVALAQKNRNSRKEKANA